MFEALRKILQYCNKAWKGNFVDWELDQLAEEYEFSIAMSNKNHIDGGIMALLMGLAEDSMNGNQEAEIYYEAIMDYIMA